VSLHAKKVFDANKEQAEHYTVIPFSLDVCTVTRKRLGKATATNRKDDGRKVTWSKKKCTCRKKEGIPCRHLLRVAMEKKMLSQVLSAEHVHEWFDRCYLVSTLLEAYETPLDAALYVDTEPTNMESVYVPSDVCTKQSVARVASNMEHVLGKVTGAKRKRCSNCEEFGHYFNICKAGEMTDEDRVSMRKLKLQQEQLVPTPIAHQLQYAMSEVRDEPPVGETAYALSIHRALLQKENPYLKGE
jgi:hypothetical protein